MIKINYKTILFLILFLSLFLNGFGIKWGLPSKQRSMLLPDFTDVGISTEDSTILNDEDSSIVGRVPPDETFARITRRFFLYTHHPDEMLTIMAISRMDPSKLDFNPKFFQYGGVFLYPVAATFKVGSVFGYVKLSKGLDYFLKHPEEISKFYILGRYLVIISCFFSLMTISSISSLLDNKKTGLLSVLMFAVLPPTIIWSHTFKPHMYGIFFALMSFYFAFRILREKRLSLYILAGVFAGLSAGAIINYGLMLFPLFLAALLYSIQHKEKIYIKGLIFSCIVFLFAFFIPNYYCIFSFKEALSEFRMFSGMWKFAPGFDVWSAYLISLKELVGFPALLLMISGFLYSLFKAIYHRDKTHILLCATTCFYFFSVASFTGSNPADIGRIRLGLILFAIFAIMSAQFIIFSIDSIKRRNFKILFIVCIVGVFLWTSAKSIVYDVNFFYDSTPRSTRLLAGKWINEHVPAGTSICLWHSPAPFNSPPFKFDDYKIIVDSSENADYVVSSFEPEWKNNQDDYILLKSFEPITSVWGFKVINPFYFANHKVSVFIRKGLYPEER